MELNPNATCYTCQRTGEIVIFGDSWAKPIFYSPDGRKFFQLVQTGFGGTSLDFSIHYDNPHNGDHGQMFCKDNAVTWNGKIFAETACPSSITFEPIPAVREPAFLFLTSDGTFIYVSRDKYNYRYETCKFFIGTSQDMKLVDITNWETYRDGGTTNITTTAGVLFSPTPFDTKAVSTWQGVKVTKLDTKDFTIEESGDTAKIKKQHTGIVPPAILELFK